ncbi:autotransporter outer membrane beta-barrel domain-containing protein [Brucella anthropi]
MMRMLVLSTSIASTGFATEAFAYDYGHYANETLERLITEYPGRYRGTTSFAGATDWMQSRLGLGYATTRQDFTWAGNRGSHNVIASAPGTSGQYLVLGAHYDTYYGRPTLQGLDDNASGAAVLTEIARNLAGIPLENGLEVVGFGAEEEGLRGSRAYVAALSDEQRANMVGMINLDSLITGDRMYAHAGGNSVDNPALTAYRDQILRIANELNIPLFTNPGLNHEYPAGTGCCSDGESFTGLDIPVLFIEATNWELGDLDGYQQTDNPAIPGGATWHMPGLDNKDVLTNAFGQARIDQRLEDFSRLLTRLVLELTGADLLASTASGGTMIRQMTDQLQRQHQALAGLHDRRWLNLLDSDRTVGTFSGEASVEGEIYPGGGFDVPDASDAKRVGFHLLGDYRYNEAWTLGGSLSFQRSRDQLANDGSIDGDSWQGAVYALYHDAASNWFAGDMNIGRTSFDNDRSVFLQAMNGPVLLNQQLQSDTSALSLGARIEGGHDFSWYGIKSGPVAGLDYMHYRIDGFSEAGALRTALDYTKQGFDSLEASIGWRLHGTMAFANGMVLKPYTSVKWVHELADGRPETIRLTSLTDGRDRIALLGDADKDFGRAQLGAQLAVSDSIGMFSEINARFAHNDGSEIGYSLGFQFRF